MPVSQMTRRDFLKTATTGAAALSLNAILHTRAHGANDRIRLGLIGCGDRGRNAHMEGIHPYDKDQNVEFVAVCDPWKVKREEAAAKAREWYGREPKQFTHYGDLLEKGEVDAVMIASCDHLHMTHLLAAAKAKKDTYCEKPMSMNQEELFRAYDAVKESGIVVQIGTQLRSFPSFTGVREFIKTGALGRISRIEQRRNSTKPYWYHYIKEVKEEDVDWKEFLMDRPFRPFDPVQYSGWYGYRDFSDGPVPGFGSHYLDLVHYITGARYPSSAVCLGGIITWKDEYKFTCPDHVQAEWLYPEGFLVSYTTNFGNGGGNTFRIFGENGSVDMLDWNKPYFTTDGALKGGEKEEQTPIADVPRPDHFLDWLQCLRSRAVPNASIDEGMLHGVGCLMAVRAFDTGQRQVYDAEKREIRAG